MANTYSQIFIQVVFAVKGRENLISEKWEGQLHKYICGIVNNSKEKVYAINGMPDHIHILLSIKPNTNLSDLVRDIKANSSKWINSQQFVKCKFNWQEGFGAFSYSSSHLNNIIAYIDNQKQHHAKISFKEEYIQTLKNFDIDYDEKYIFEFEEQTVALD